MSSKKKLSEQTMKLLGFSKKEITKDEDGELVPRLDVTDVVLVHCNLVNNSYQQASKSFNKFHSRWEFWTIT